MLFSALFHSTLFTFVTPYKLLRKKWVAFPEIHLYCAPSDLVCPVSLNPFFNNFLTFLCYSWLFSIKLVFSFSTMYFSETALKSNPLGFWRIVAVREIIPFWRVTLFSRILIRFFLVWAESWLCWTCWMPTAAASVGMDSNGASSAGFAKVQEFSYF